MNNPVSKQISVLRIMETLGVIFIHTCNTISNNKEMYDLSTGQYTLLKIGYTSMHWAVPIFFMITGSLLLNPQKKIELSDCVCKYVKKVIVALFIFGTLFAGIEVFVNTHILGAFVVFI